MSERQWVRQWELFHEALERLPQERDEYVRKACGGDEELLGALRKLLASHARSSGLLDRTEAMRAAVEHSSGAEAIVGESIGPYRIEGVLGEGGMGVVYAAHQQQPVRRRVALKLIKLGMDSKEIVARFESERQALAIMNHPRIAKVFDAGVTERGRPYFVMEYVPGIALTEYCDMRALGLRDRLALFQQACEAIEHAHRQGIIHRDVKPSNILVASVDGKPSLKVIDFGVAKAIGCGAADKSSYTRHGMMIGTPEYMSPEQAGTTALDVNARTDVYALGVVLYELLVGALPFDPVTLRHAAGMEMLRIIREEQPPRLSARVASLGEAVSDVAKSRHLDERSLIKVLRGELEWMTMRALEKDPDRRYPSASAFAEDIGRYLTDHPVHAGPPSVTYRLQKFLRRNRNAAIAAAVVLALVTAFALQSRRAAQLADRQVEAQSALAALRRSVDSQGMSVRKVFSGDAMGRPSPNGRYQSFVDWRTGDIAIHDLDANESRVLTHQGGWDRPARYGDVSIWSPDSRQVAYAWINEDLGYDLRVVDLEGGAPRVLYHDPKIGYPWPRAWSLDGKSILANFHRYDESLREGHEDQIALIRVADGSMRILKSLGEQHTRNMDLSPDGRSVVYDLQDESGSEDRNIYLLSVDGSGSRLIDDVADDWAPFWTPDGLSITFVSDRSGVLGLWRLAVMDGRPIGQAAAVQLGLGQGVVPMGMTSGGDYYYATGRLDLDVYVTEIDVARAEVQGPPTKQASRGHDGVNETPFWAPDGRRLGFYSQRSINRELIKTTVVIRDVASGVERDLEVEGASLFEVRFWATPHFDRQGRTFLTNGMAPNGQKQLVRVDTATGEAELLVDRDANAIDASWPIFSAGEDQIFYSAGQGGAIRAFTLATGQTSTLHDGDPYVYNLTLSPDGQRLAFFTAEQALRARKLRVLSIADRAVETLLELPEGEYFDWQPGLVWTPDGKYMLFASGCCSDQPKELWRVGSSDGVRQPIMTLPEGTVRHMDLHPDGRRLAFAAGKPKSSDIWALRTDLD